MSIPATKLKERFGDSRKRRPNKLETKPSRLHRTLTFDRLKGLRLTGETPFGGWAFRGPLKMPIAWDVV